MSEANTNLQELRFAEQRLYCHRIVEQEYLNNNCVTFSSDKFKPYEVDGKRIVQKMPLYLFMDRLVENFDIRFKKQDISWPKRIRKVNNR